ncbi:Na+/H+ antiporter subunit E [Nocardia arthritidis]|uniref:Uncharacterized protein n=1 Tax=Nocardia arthritidis TaxID=228602 RepID=A0A6G9YN01_9NOCA|nr:Na+/H+ antiporter subunit E [Nocardia arthritidis]QIS14416.1 hypothetical protein F5544_32895 [Nocardia arthritidis]
MSRIASAVEAGAWWVVCVLIWLATVTVFTVQELLAACVFGVPCALVAQRARLAVRGSWRPPPELPRLLPALVAAVAADSAGALRLAVRTGREFGERTEIPLAETDSGARRSGREAAATMLFSATPGTIVVDSVEDGKKLVAHAFPLPETRLARSLRRAEAD